nr:SHOCT domain-containing protein [Thermoanaerobacter wiegelii]
MIISIYVSNYITRPLVNITEVAKKLEKGDFTAKVYDIPKEELFKLTAAIYFIISLFRGTKNRNKERDAIEILKERYARGEISEEEYLERKKYLKKNNYIIIFTPAHLSSLILHLLVLRRLP